MACISEKGNGIYIEPDENEHLTVLGEDGVIKIEIHKNLNDTDKRWNTYNQENKKREKK